MVPLSSRVSNYSLKYRSLDGRTTGARPGRTTSERPEQTYTQRSVSNGCTPASPKRTMPIRFSSFSAPGGRCRSWPNRPELDAGGVPGDAEHVSDFLRLGPLARRQAARAEHCRALASDSAAAARARCPSPSERGEIQKVPDIAGLTV